MALFTVGTVKHNGKEFPPGTEIKSGDMSVEVARGLLEAGALTQTDPNGEDTPPPEVLDSPATEENDSGDSE